MDLFTRLILLVALAVVPVVAMQTQTILDRREERLAEVEGKASHLLRLAEGQQARLVEGVRQVAGAISEAAFLRDGAVDRCQTYLERLARRSPDYQTISVTDREGRILCSGAPDARGISIGDLPVISRALQENHFAVGEWTLWPVDGMPVLPFAVPYLGADGKPGGAVVVSLSLGWLAASFAEGSLPVGADLVVADREGTVLLRLPTNAAAPGERLPDTYRRLLTARESGVGILPGLTGGRQVVAYSPAGNGINGLFLSVGLDADGVMAAVDEATGDDVLTILYGVGLALLVAWLGASVWLRRPVRALMRAAERWQAGDTRARSGIADSPSELGRLGQAFDRMAEALESRERDLRRKGEHLRHVLDSLHGFVAVLTPDGVLVEINRAALDAVGTTAEAVLGRPFAETPWWAGLPDATDKLIAAVRAAAHGGITRFEVANRGTGNRILTVDVRVAPMQDPDGTVRHIVVSAMDISERRRTEDALYVAQERFHAALRNSGVVVFNQDRDLRYTWIDSSAFGIRPDEIIGRDDRVLFDEPAEAVALTTVKQRVLDSGEGTRVEARIRRNGEKKVFDLTIDPLRDGAGRVVGITCAAVDVTGRKRMEEALRTAKEEAERANAAKSKIMAAASHDLRQPVQSLFLFAEALADRLREHPAEPLLGNLYRALNALKAMLDGLLDMSRLENGKIEPALADFALDPLLRQLRAEYAPRAQEKGLDLRVLPCSLRVRSDPALLERILRNFIENALRYTRKGRILIGGRRVPGGVRLEVLDSGIGIPRDRQDEIFEEFSQIGDGGSERGLGLGLAIVRRLARLLDHPVALRSQPGRGSAFTLTVPRAATPEPAARHTQPANDVGKPGLVLVIDDEAIILLGLKAMLEGWGYEVIAARSADQAVNALRADGRRPLMMLADYRLQNGHTGPEALVRLRGLCGGDVPGVILTGDTTPERAEEAREGGFRLMHKPVFPSELRKLVAAAGGR